MNRRKSSTARLTGHYSVLRLLLSKFLSQTWIAQIENQNIEKEEKRQENGRE
jgi:hypothetical protein